jgi:hypothetical protein
MRNGTDRQKSQPPSVTGCDGHRTPERIARECLAEAGNNPDRAITLAGRRARGATLRATVAAIGTAFLRTSVDGRTS